MTKMHDVICVKKSAKMSVCRNVSPLDASSVTSPYRCAASCAYLQVNQQRLLQPKSLDDTSEILLVRKPRVRNTHPQNALDRINSYHKKLDATSEKTVDKNFFTQTGAHARPPRMSRKASNTLRAHLKRLDKLIWAARAAFAIRTTKNQ